MSFCYRKLKKDWKDVKIRSNKKLDIKKSCNRLGVRGGDRVDAKSLHFVVNAPSRN